MDRSGIADRRGDEDIEVSLLKKIDARIRCVGSALEGRLSHEVASAGKSRCVGRYGLGVGAGWGRFEEFGVQEPLGREESARKRTAEKSEVGQVRRTLRWNDYTSLAPDEEVAIRPQFLFETIRPMIMDYVKSYLHDFKISFMQSISEQVLSMIARSNIDIQPQYSSQEVNRLRTKVVIYS